MSASQFRAALSEAGLTQRGAARALGINERTVRRYAAGTPVPRVVWLALQHLASQKRGG
jgi:transcriptional regulator with XRE-family HTH domain